MTQRRVRYAGFDTRELCVEGAGPTIVLLHGFAHSADCWRPVLERLDRAGHAATAVDLAGFGHADPLAPGPRLPQLDAFVAEVIARHATDGPVVLTGNSLGGLLTVRAASRTLPIRGILPIGATGTGWTRTVRMAAVGNLALFRLLAAMPAPAAARHVSASLIARAVLYGHWRAADPAIVHDLIDQVRTRRGIRQLVTAAVPIAAEVNALQPRQAVSCPAIVLHGRRDRLVSVAAARRLHEMIPHSTLELLPHCGHCPQLDAPGRVATLAIELATANPDRHCTTA
jgi:pimeloyl-ACP methyl ester carboxylesterase